MTRERVITPEKLERAIELRERGKTLGQIERATGLRRSLLSWHFLANGVEGPKPTKLKPDFYLKCPVVKRGSHIVRAFTPEEDAKLIELEAEGLSMTAIGKQLGRKPNSIRGRLMTLARHEERGVR